MRKEKKSQELQFITAQEAHQMSLNSTGYQKVCQDIIKNIIRYTNLGWFKFWMSLDSEIPIETYEEVKKEFISLGYDCSISDERFHISWL